LYEGLGLACAYSSRTIRFPWHVIESLDSIAKGIDVTTVETDASRDEQAEDCIGLPPGLLTAARALPGRVILCAFQADIPIAAAAFDPAFPGAFPFRLRRDAPLGTAVMLLREMKRHRKEDLPFVQVVVEDNDALAMLLMNHGGELTMDTLHYEGKVA
jgi:hypothetical protein